MDALQICSSMSRFGGGIGQGKGGGAGNRASAAQHWQTGAGGAGARVGRLWVEQPMCQGNTDCCGTHEQGWACSCKVVRHVASAIESAVHFTQTSHKFPPISSGLPVAEVRPVGRIGGAVRGHRWLRVPIHMRIGCTDTGACGQGWDLRPGRRHRGGDGGAGH